MTNENTSTTEKKMPTYVLTLLRKDGGRYAPKVAVTFETERGNQRIVWNVLPSSLELQSGTLVLVPYKEKISENGTGEMME